MSIHRFTHDFGQGRVMTVLLDTERQTEEEEAGVVYERSHAGKFSQEDYGALDRWMINAVLPATAKVLGRSFTWAKQDKERRALLYHCTADGFVRFVGPITLP